MKDLQKIFETSLDTADIYKLAYKLTLSEIEENGYSPKEFYTSFELCLKNKNMLNEQNQTKLIRAITKAFIHKDEQSIYDDIEKLNMLRSKINDKKEQLRYKIYDIFESFEVKSELLDEAKLYDMELLGMMQETVSSAIIAVLEQGVMVDDRIKNISADMFYLTLCEGEFSNERAINIAKSILNPALEIANEWKNYTQNIVSSCVFGIYEGIFKSLERLKKELEYELIEEQLQKKALMLVSFERDFTKLLYEFSKYDNSANKVLKTLLEENLDTTFAKSKRIFAELTENIRLKLITTKTHEKINTIKKELEEAKQTARARYNELRSKDAKNIGEKLAKKAKQFIDNIGKK